MLLQGFLFSRHQGKSLLELRRGLVMVSFTEFIIKISNIFFQFSPICSSFHFTVSRQSVVIDSRTFNPRKQRQSQVIGDLRPRKTSLTPDSVFDPRSRRPRSAYAMDEND